MAQQTRLPAKKWGLFRGWWIVVAGFVHAFFGYGHWLYAWSTFVPILIREFKLTAAQMGLPSTLGRVEGGLEGPLAGWIQGKWGAKVLALFGMTSVTVGWIMIATIPSEEAAFWFIIIGYGVLVQTGMNMSIYQASEVTAAKWFIKRRTAAMSLITVGGGLGATFLVPGTQFMQQNIGFRGAAMVAVAAVVILCMPLSFFFPRHLPEHYGLRPDNMSDEEFRRMQEAVAAGARSDRVHDVSLTLAQVLRTWQFWGVGIAIAFYGFSVIALPVFQNVAMQDAGYTGMEAATFYSINFIFSAIGRFVPTLYGDRVHPKWMVVILWVVLAYGLFAFSNIKVSPFFLWSWVVLYGFCHGNNQPFQGVMKAWYFGREGYHHTFGWLNLVAAAGLIPGPVLAGWIRDVTGSYDVAFQVSVGTMLIAAALLALTPRPKPKAPTPVPTIA